MPKRKPPTRPLPSPRTAQSPDAAALAKRLMSPAGLSATANIHFDGQTFAEALERCIERSKSPPMLNGPVEELPASELKKPFVRSNYRRF
jgi:hypothetical protein